MSLTQNEVIHNLALGYIGEYQVEDTAVSRALKQNKLCIRYYEQSRDEVLKAHPWNEAKKRVIIVQNNDFPIFGYDRTYIKPTDSIKVLSVNNSLGADQRNKAMGVDAWEVENTLILSNAGETPQTWATDTKYVDGEFVSSTARIWAASTAYVVDEFVKDGSLVYQVLLAHTSDTIANDVTAGNLATGIQGSTGTYEVLVSHISDTILNDIASGNIEAKASEARIIFVEYIQKLTDTDKWGSTLKQAIAMKLAIKIAIGITNDTEIRTNLINEFEQLTMPKARSIDGAEGTAKPIFNSEWIRARTSGTGGY